MHVSKQLLAQLLHRQFAERIATINSRFFGVHRLPALKFICVCVYLLAYINLESSFSTFVV